MKINDNRVKTAIIENWFAIDYILFGTDKPRKVLTKESYSKFMRLKPAMCLNLYQIYKTLGTQSNNRYQTLAESKTFAKALAENSIEFAKKFVTDKNNASLILQESKNLNFGKYQLSERQAVAYLTKRKIVSTALDQLLLKEAIENSKAKIDMKDLKHKLLFDGHRRFRDSLVEMCLS